MTITHKRRRREVFAPQENIVEMRGEILRWMRDMGWAQEVIDEILYRDNPSPDVVRYLVYRNGPVRTYELLQALYE